MCSQRPGANFSPALLHARFFEMAKNPASEAKCAIRFGEQVITYKELAARALQISSFLVGKGLQPGDGVGLLACRTPDTIAAMLGILACGAYWLPLDPHNPTQRNIFCLSDCGCRILLTDSLERADHYGKSLDSHLLSSIDAAYSVGALPPVAPGARAYTIYTSGSTGKPKGVAVSHSAASSLVDWALHEFGKEDLSRTLAATPFSFDVSVFEVFAPLSAGGSIDLVSSILSLADRARLGELTLISGVPTAVAALVRFGLDFGGVRNMLLAGEAMPPGLVRELLAAGVEGVWNLYGPTEDTVYSTAQRLTRATMAKDLSHGDVPIGKPLPGHIVRIVDEDGKEVAPHSIGELCLQGVGLTDGWINRPEETKRAFQPSTCAPEGARIIYRTGDRAWRDDEGTLHFAGRLDDQIKWRGHRIELQEIRAVLEEVTGVLRVEVQLCPCATGWLDRSELTAWILPSPGASQSAVEQDILSLAKRALPEWMRPTALHFVPSLPLGRHGKMDRTVLLAQRGRARSTS